MLLKLLAGGPDHRWVPLLVAERAALEAVRSLVPEVSWERLRFVSALPAREALAAAGEIVVVDPIGSPRAVLPGTSGPDDARAALAALDLGIDLAQSGAADALVTLPVSKGSIAQHVLPAFRGHTDYLAAACGLERYGRDYLMVFLAPGLEVALLTVHLPLRQALDAIHTEAVLEALICLARHRGGRIALAGLNPHAGEGGLLGHEEAQVLAPAVTAARARGVDAYGPESADSVFARTRAGAFDRVLALYHDQGLIAVKSAAYGRATNWTLGLPFLRTSVDHGTAFDRAGRGVADSTPLRAVVDTTLDLLAQARSPASKSRGAAG